jgi:hypothetical protein
VTEAIDSILRLPALFIEMQRAVTGGYQIIPLEVGALERLPVYPAARLAVLISGPGTDEAAVVKQLGDNRGRHIAGYSPRPIRIISWRQSFEAAAK